MTVQTLTYIHNLLIENETKAEYKLRWIRETYNQMSDAFDEGNVCKSEYESIKQQYDEARAAHSAAYDARVNFESKEW